MKTIRAGLILALVLASTSTTIHASDKADFVYVDKSEGKLHLSYQGRVFKTYKVALGAVPVGHKVREGDKRTPEGLYMLDYKKEDSDFYRAIRISYPNREDVHKARSLGIKPGGAIMIHGQKKGLERFTQITQEYNWTDGCIALTNKDIDEVWAAIEIPTPIRITP